MRLEIDTAEPFHNRIVDKKITDLSELSASIRERVHFQVCWVGLVAGFGEFGATFVCFVGGFVAELWLLLVGAVGLFCCMGCVVHNFTFLLYLQNSASSSTTVWR